MKAYPLVWNSPEKFKNHIITIDIFHIIMADFSGSDFSDFLLEEGMIITGSMTEVMIGKNYS